MTHTFRKLIACIALVPSSVLAATTCEKYASDLQLLLLDAGPAKFVTITSNPYDKTSQDIGCATDGRFGRNVDLRLYQTKGGAADVVRAAMQRYANSRLPSVPVSDATLGSQGFVWLTTIGGGSPPNVLIVAGHNAGVYIRLEIMSSHSRYQFSEKDIEVARNLVKKVIDDVAF